MNEQKATTAKVDAQFGKRETLVRFGITAAVVLVIVLGLYVLIDYPYRQSFATVYNEVEKVRRDVIAPAGGVEHTRPGMPDLRGNGFLDSVSCWPDANCPNITREWFVPIDSGKEAQLVDTIIQIEGYRQDGSEGTKGKFRIDVTINPIDKIQPPSPAPTGKEWQFVAVRVTRY